MTERIALALARPVATDGEVGRGHNGAEQHHGPAHGQREQLGGVEDVGDQVARDHHAGVGRRRHVAGAVGRLD